MKDFEQSTNNSESVTKPSSKSLTLPFAIIVSAIFFGGIGYMLGLYHVGYPTMTKSYTQPSPTSSPSVTYSPIPSTGPYVTGTPEQDSIKDWVQKFYKLWIVQFYGRDTSPLISQGYITTNAATAINEDKGSDLPTCSQNSLNPDMYDYSTPIINGNTATMNLKGTYGTPQEPTFVAIYLNLVKIGSKWSINSFDCSANK